VIPIGATVIGHDFKIATLEGNTNDFADIRAGVSLLIAALSAKGTSTIHKHRGKLMRVTKNIDERYVL